MESLDALPRAINMITGPSRSILGVHGVRRLRVVIVSKE
jgi:L-lactate utilization protein LutC